MERLIISTPTLLLRLDPQEIAFIEAEKNYSAIYLSNGRTIQLCTQLHVFEDSLAKLKGGKRFARVGRSLLVNKDFIYMVSLTKEELHLTLTALDKKLDLTGLSVEERLKAAREAKNHGCRSVIHASREALEELMKELQNEKD